METTSNLDVAPPQLSPQAQAFRAAILEDLGPRARGMDRPVKELRRESRELAARYSGTPEHVEAIEDIDANGIRVRLYRPKEPSLNVLVWFHGGAWMLGDLDDNNTLACALVNRVGCNVVSVDYRLAPEHPYPAPIEDCWTATKWALGQFDSVAVGGDSAGGNLAAAVALRARDRGIKPAMQLLVYPALDAELQSPFLTDFVCRYDDFADDPGFGEQALAALRHVWDVYIPERAQQTQVDASPLRASSLAGLAPAVIILAEHDPLRGEGEEYARRLLAAGVPVQLHLYEGQMHGFFNLLGAMDDGWDAVGRASVALRAAFSSQADAS